MTPTPDTTAILAAGAAAPLEATRSGAGAKAPLPISDLLAALERRDQDAKRSRPSAAIEPTDVSLVAADPSGAALAAMQARFRTDVAGGLMGRHHNSYQHRSRVLRRLADEERA